MQHKEWAEIAWRLNTVAGHIHTLCSSVEAGKPCGEVLHQVKAVQVSLRSIKIRLIRFQIEQSETIVLHGNLEERIEELASLHILYKFILSKT